MVRLALGLALSALVALVGVFVLVSILEDAERLWRTAGWVGLAIFFAMPVIVFVGGTLLDDRYRRP